MTCTLSEESGLKVVQCVVLSTWSHTLGPQVVFTWSPTAESRDCPELAQLTAHLLYPDILANSERHPCSIRCKVLVLPKHQVILQSRVFRAPEWEELECPLALTLVYSYSQLHTVWSIYRVTETTLTRMVKTLRKCKHPSIGAALIHKRMVELSSLLDRIHGCQSHSGMETATLGKGIRWTSPFVIKCLVSHLQTGGRTVVIGSNDLYLSKLPEFLMHFLLDSEKACSVSTIPKAGWLFAPGAHLQTLRKGDYESTEDLFRDLKLGSKIPTVIDLDRLKVKQVEDSPEKRSSIDLGLPKSKNQLKPVSDLGTMVPDFMEELSLADPDELNWIFRRHLLIKGALSAKIIRDCCPKPSQLKGMLGVSEDADLKIILSHTNKLWPRPP